MNELKEKIDKLLEQVPYITIASVTPEGMPWNTPVFAVRDGQNNFIWNSVVDAQHSKNIASNKNIFIVIFDPAAAEAFGLYIQAEAEVLDAGPELEQAIEAFYRKKNKAPTSASEFLSPNSRRMYLAKPQKVWINRFEKGRVPPDWREEINL